MFVKYCKKARYENKNQQRDAFIFENNEKHFPYKHTATSCIVSANLLHRKRENILKKKNNCFRAREKKTAVLPHLKKHRIKQPVNFQSLHSYIKPNKTEATETNQIIQRSIINSQRPVKFCKTIEQTLETNQNNPARKLRMNHSENLNHGCIYLILKSFIEKH